LLLDVGNDNPTSQISSQFSPEIQDESLKNFARGMRRLHSIPIGSTKEIFEAIVAGRLNLDDTMAHAIAQHRLRDIDSINGQFNDIMENRRTLGEDYLRDANLVFYWAKALDLMS
jgi:hypothetical protein